MTKHCIMMQIILQKQRSRNYKEETYFKYRVTIPVGIIDALGLDGGDVLDVVQDNDRIVIKRSQEQRKPQKNSKIDDTFLPHII